MSTIDEVISMHAGCPADSCHARVLADEVARLRVRTLVLTVQQESEAHYLTERFDEFKAEIDALPVDALTVKRAAKVVMAEQEKWRQVRGARVVRKALDDAAAAVRALGE